MVSDIYKVSISIHALLAESDTERLCNALENLHFYPRSPCGERPMQIVIVVVDALFLSTLSLRRATIFLHPPVLISPFLSTLSLRRATQHESAGDTYQNGFLSTLSLRRATVEQSACPFLQSISIHALLAESDCSAGFGFCRPRYFYPRSPCGERPSCPRPCEHPTRDFYPRSPCGERLDGSKSSIEEVSFLSTLSLRRATKIP